MSYYLRQHIENSKSDYPSGIQSSGILTEHVTCVKGYSNPLWMCAKGYYELYDDTDKKCIPIHYSYKTMEVSKLTTLHPVLFTRKYANHCLVD